MLVTAAFGHRVPRAEAPRTYIECDQDNPVDVPDNSYYQRRLLEGVLVQVKKRGAKPATKGASK